MKRADLDRRLVLLQRQITKGALNSDVETWFDFATVWAGYKPVSDSERLRSAEVAAVIEARFQIRWSTTVASLNPTFRLRFDGREWDIVAVKEIGRRAGLEISASARADRVVL